MFLFLLSSLLISPAMSDRSMIFGIKTTSTVWNVNQLAILKLTLFWEDSRYQCIINATNAATNTVYQCDTADTATTYQCDSNSNSNRFALQIDENQYSSIIPTLFDHIIIENITDGVPTMTYNIAVNEAQIYRYTLFIPYDFTSLQSVNSMTETALCPPVSSVFGFYMGRNSAGGGSINTVTMTFSWEYSRYQCNVFPETYDESIYWTCDTTDMDTTECDGSTNDALYALQLDIDGTDGFSIDRVLVQNVYTGNIMMDSYDIDWFYTAIPGVPDKCKDKTVYQFIWLDGDGGSCMNGYANTLLILNDYFYNMTSSRIYDALDFAQCLPPTPKPTMKPTPQTLSPTDDPSTSTTTTSHPTILPSNNASLFPSVFPTQAPVIKPTINPTSVPTQSPLIEPTNNPTSVHVPSDITTLSPIPTSVASDSVVLSSSIDDSTATSVSPSSDLINITNTKRGIDYVLYLLIIASVFCIICIGFIIYKKKTKSSAYRISSVALSANSVRHGTISIKISNDSKEDDMTQNVVPAVEVVGVVIKEISTVNKTEIIHKKNTETFRDFDFINKRPQIERRNSEDMYVNPPLDDNVETTKGYTADVEERRVKLDDEKDIAMETLGEQDSVRHDIRTSPAIMEQIKGYKANAETIQVKQWLDNVVELPVYYQIFIINGFDTLNRIRQIDSKDVLTRIGITPFGHQTRIMYEIGKLRETQRTESVSSESMSNEVMATPMGEREDTIEKSGEIDAQGPVALASSFKGPVLGHGSASAELLPADLHDIQSARKTPPSIHVLSEQRVPPPVPPDVYRLGSLSDVQFVSAAPLDGVIEDVEDIGYTIEFN